MTLVATDEMKVLFFILSYIHSPSTYSTLSLSVSQREHRIIIS